MDKVRIILKYLISAFNCSTVFTCDAEAVRKVPRRFLVDVYEFLGLSQHNFLFNHSQFDLGGKIKHVHLRFCYKQAFSVTLQSCTSLRIDGYVLVE